MLDKQHSCLIVEKDFALRKELAMCVRSHGFIAEFCDDLTYDVEGFEEPDAVLIGDHVDVPVLGDTIGTIELIIREFNVPVLAPPHLKGKLLQRFEDVHVYDGAEIMSQMVFSYVMNHASRRLIRNEMLVAMKGVHNLCEAEFSFKSIEQGQALAILIATLAPQKKLLRLGLTELFVNSVEHGNLEIKSAEKEKFRNEGSWSFEVEKRLCSPSFCNRQVSLKMSRIEKTVKLRIEDEGPGFNWQDTVQKSIENQGVLKSGRGMRIARKSGFDRYEYIGNGNIVECEFVVQDGT